jgi:hypothetical protein
VVLKFNRRHASPTFFILFVQTIADTTMAPSSSQSVRIDARCHTERARTIRAGANRKCDDRKGTQRPQSGDRFRVYTALSMPRSLRTVRLSRFAIFQLGSGIHPRAGFRSTIAMANDQTSAIEPHRYSARKTHAVYPASFIVQVFLRGFGREIEIDSARFNVRRQLTHKLTQTSDPSTLSATDPWWVRVNVIGRERH